MNPEDPAKGDEPAFDSHGDGAGGHPPGEVGPAVLGAQRSPGGPNSPRGDDIDRTGFVTPAVVLRRWRSMVLGLSQEDGARKLRVSRPHLANMESGARSVPRDSWGDLDKAYEAGGLLESLLRASAVTSLPPRHLWSHPYDHEPRRVWMWLRAVAPNTPARITWGPMSLSIGALPHPEGLIVTSPTSWENPQAEVHFDPGTGLGWAGFGSGVVPEQFGVDQLDGAAAVSSPPWEYSSLVRRLQTALKGLGKLDWDWSEITGLASYFKIREDAIPHLSSVMPGDSPLRVAGDHPLLPAAGSPEVRLILPGELKRLREDAGWKIAELARHASQLEHAPAPVSEDDVRGAEAGRTSRHEYLLAMIDRTLGLDGRSCLAPVPPKGRNRGTITVSFPAFWIGPVYLQFVSRQPERRQRRMTLTWGPWRRRLDVSPGAVVTTRRSTLDAPPLRVDLPPGWTVLAGLGWPPGAHDVGEGWRPDGLSGMLQLLGAAIAAIRAQRDQEKTN